MWTGGLQKIVVNKKKTMGHIGTIENKSMSK